MPVVFWLVLFFSVWTALAVWTVLKSREQPDGSDHGWGATRLPVMPGAGLVLIPSTRRR